MIHLHQFSLLNQKHSAQPVKFNSQTNDSYEPVLVMNDSRRLTNSGIAIWINVMDLLLNELTKSITESLTESIHSVDWINIKSP